MIPLKKLRSLERCYTHKNCPDGTASALILRDALPDLQIHFVAYGSQEHKSIEPLPNTIFCDFSPYIGDTSMGVNKEPGSVCDMWIQEGVVVLDHHDPKIVEPYPFGVFGENSKLECGAWLAYEHVWLPLKKDNNPEPVWEHMRGPVRDFAHLAAIRDTWKKDSPVFFERACRQASVLMFYRFEQLTIPMVSEMQETLAPRLFERQIELAESCIKEAFTFTSERGTRVLMFQGVSATSDAAEILEKKCVAGGEDWSDPASRGLQPNLVVGFHYRNEGDTLKLQFSSRSHTGYDCQALARANGGNGHKAAAGFTIEAHVGNAVTGMNPYAVFQWLLKEYEAKL